MAVEKEIKVPNIGGAVGVDVIEILVKVGDEIKEETPLITLESDKASMEIPSPAAGRVRSLHVKLGDKVSEGDLILTFSPSEGGLEPLVKSENQLTEEEKSKTDESQVSSSSTPVKKDMDKEANIIPLESGTEQASEIFAGPAVRRLARELGVNLAEVRGTGRKSRILKEDIQLYVKSKLQEQSASSGFLLPTTPSVDFSQFGDVEVKPLNKIKRLTGIHVHRSWASIPHVTQFDEADITELEAFRKLELEQTKHLGFKLTILAFICKVVSKALVVFPQFNSSLDASAENLIYKQYINIGVAVDTPNGLVVPVIKEVDRLSIRDIAKEMGRLSSKARDKGLTPLEMSGGCFTISSLGGIGGTAFTPIVNSPEVAILGVSRAMIKPIYLNGEFKPRLMLPLSLSYDHRVIDGAEAARFTCFLTDCLRDIRKILLV